MALYKGKLTEGDFFAGKLFGGNAPVVITDRLKYWNGSAWVGRSFKYWDGSAFQTKTLKVWTGSSWLS